MQLLSISPLSLVNQDFSTITLIKIESATVIVEYTSHEVLVYAGDGCFLCYMDRVEAGTVLELIF